MAEDVLTKCRSIVISSTCIPPASREWLNNVLENRGILNDVDVSQNIFDASSTSPLNLPQTEEPAALSIYTTTSQVTSRRTVHHVSQQLSINSYIFLREHPNTNMLILGRVITFNSEHVLVNVAHIVKKKEEYFVQFRSGEEF
eukprot:TRINITY_DN2099_c0_g2_i1.p1 TRINITY_DN2099_c0_g2~~TRINITY_DN2099_c0_g2_i1.p1  ORF type:complete len:143 (+),score=25.31 TRINITY_DN2099_c0_g2_i1:61-489(+)